MEQSINELCLDTNVTFITEPIKGETGILRSKHSIEKLYESSMTVLELFEDNFEAKKFLSIRIVGGNTNRDINYEQLRDYARGFTTIVKEKGLVTEVNLDEKDWKFIGIYSKNCPEWIIAHIGNMYNDVTTVSIYDTFGKEGICHILNLTKLKTIVIQDIFINKIVELSKEGKLSYLENLIVISDNQLDTDSQDIVYLKENGICIHEFKNIYEEGINIVINSVTPELLFNRCKLDSISVISFTSGSTGIPKGALISHKSLSTMNLSVIKTYELPLHFQDTHFSYLPYAHIFEQLFLTFCLSVGMEIEYYSGNTLNLAADILKAKPSYFIAVPRVLLKFYDVISSKLQPFLENGKELSSLDHKIFEAIKKGIFGRTSLNFVLVGAAPIDGKILDFFKIVLGCPVVQAYGMTEVAGATSISSLHDISGHVGTPNSCLEIKLVDVPELNYYTTYTDSNGQLTPRGELLVRGNTTFSGYLCQPEETSQLIDKEGWIHSGDIATLLPGNRLRIIDRRKNIFKLSQGEYVAPEKIENILKLNNNFLQTFVYGKVTESYLVVLIVTEPQILSKIAQSLNITFSDSQELLTHPEINKEMLLETEKTCKNANLTGFEIPKKVLLTYSPFTIDNGMLTVTLKSMRTTIKTHWENKLLELYY